MKTSQEVRDAAKGQNNTLSTADIRAAMARKAEEFKQGWRGELFTEERGGVRQHHPFARFFCLVERLDPGCVEASGTGSLTTPS
jgi:hypothetical protein